MDDVEEKRGLGVYSSVRKVNEMLADIIIAAQDQELQPPAKNSLQLLYCPSVPRGALRKVGRTAPSLAHTGEAGPPGACLPLLA